MIQAQNIQEGLSNKEWNKVLDKYLLTQTMFSSDYQDLNDEQRLVIQTLKRAFKRFKKNG